MLIVVFNWMVAVQHRDGGGAEASQHEKQLYNMLSNNYNKHVRPVKHDADPVRVRVAFSLVEVLSIDENNGQLTVKAWLTMASHLRSSFISFHFISRIAIDSSHLTASSSAS